MCKVGWVGISAAHDDLLKIWVGYSSLSCSVEKKSNRIKSLGSSPGSMSGLGAGHFVELIVDLNELVDTGCGM